MLLTHYHCVFLKQETECSLVSHNIDCEMFILPTEFLEIYERLGSNNLCFLKTSNDFQLPSTESSIEFSFQQKDKCWFLWHEYYSERKWRRNKTT